MKKIIKKILKEEQDNIDIHPDYEGVLETPSDALFYISYAELKIGLMVMREMNYPARKGRDWVSRFTRSLKEKYLIEDKKILTRMVLIFYFNELVDLEDALNFKELSYLYRGPFYECEMEYYDELDTTYEYEDEECYDCDGYGEEECPECGGSGWADEEEEEECAECGGHGQINCEVCDGSGEVENEVEYYTLDQRTVEIISKHPLKMSNYSYASDVINDTDLLISDDQWVTEEKEREGNEWELEQNENTISDIYGEDIMSNKDILSTSFY